MRCRIMLSETKLEFKDNIIFIDIVGRGVLIPPIL